MENKNFNKKYKLNTINKKMFFPARSDQKNITEVVGKPKKIIYEILKRFFRNPFYLIALFLFLTIVILSIVFPLFSPHSGDKKIVDDLPGFFTESLPPSSDPFVKDRIMNSTNLELLKNLQKALDGVVNIDIKNDLTKIPATNVVTYNAYEALKAALLTINPDLDPSQANVTTYLGTTNDGLDIWTRTWISTLESFQIALIVATIETILGIAIGIYLGFHVGSWIDTIFLRLIEIFRLLPQIVFFLVMIAIFGTEFWSLVIALLLIGWTAPINEARLFTLIIKDREFVVAAESIGVSKVRRIIVHIFPAIVGKLANSYVLRIPRIIFLVSALAFLGFLSDPTSTNLGTVLNHASSNYTSNIWALIFPASILLVSTLSLQFIAIGFHDALNPRLETK